MAFFERYSHKKVLLLVSVFLTQARGRERTRDLERD